MKKAFRIVVGLMFLFAALNAFGGGLYALAGAPEIPKQWLESSPFPDYLIPGIILFAVVGGSFLAAAVAMLRNSQNALPLAYFSLMVVAIWLIVQLAIIGYVSALQPVTAAYSATILVLLFAGRQR